LNELGFFEADDQGLIAMADAGFLQILGRNEALGLPLGPLVFPDDAEAPGWLEALGVAGGRRMGPHPHAPERKWLELVARRTRHGLTGVLLDRTAAYELTERYESLVGASPFGVVIIQDGLVVYSNAAQEQMYPTLGRRADELLRETLHPDDYELVVGRIRARDEGDDDVPENYRYRQIRDGRVEWQEVWSTRIVYRGRPAILAMVLEVTSAVALEEQLRHAQKMDAIGRLAGGIAHDFNNLLTVMSIASTMARQHGDARAAHAELDQIDEAAHRAARLTQQLLTFSRRQPSSPRAIDVNSAVDQLLRMLRRLVGEQVTVSVVLDGRQPVVRIDPGQLDQVITNLVVNARDAMPDGGQVSIETGLEGELAVIDVTDQGGGISPEDLPQIFDPFFTTKAVDRGTGLGLATVLGIVQEAGGDIQVRSAPGEGTRMRVLLPRHVQAPPVGTNAKESRTGAMSGRILVVEDEPAVRRLIARTLERAGLQCRAVSDGQEALRTLEEGFRADVVLSDVVMPNLSGTELARLVATRWPDLPVILMTGYAGDDVPTDWPVIAKPFAPRQLIEAITKALRQSGATEADPPSTD
jgi:PAS domain S-box-containing protein